MTEYKMICKNKDCEYYNNGQPHWNCKHMDKDNLIKVKK